MIAAGRPRATTTRPSVRGVAGWFHDRPGSYTSFLLLLFAATPGLRRVVDWKSSFTALSIVSILPLIAMLPAVYALLTTSASKRIDRRMIVLTWIWFGGFVYAYGVGFFAGTAIPGTYTLAEFGLPLLFALWVSTISAPLGTIYERIAKSILLLATASSVYAFFQYGAPPPWDVAWMERVKVVSIGIAAPFSFRPFSTLNAPGPYADFLVGAIVFNMPRMRRANPMRVAQMALCVGALVITLVRADWIGLLIGLLIYIVLSPGKALNLTIVGVLALAVVGLTLNAQTLLGSSAAGVSLQKRFDTLQSLQTDTSYIARERYFGDLLSSAIAQPTGVGLGVLGVAAKLGDKGQTVDFDNGDIARFTEMGYFGMLCYLGALVYAIVLCVWRWRIWVARGNREYASIAAAAIAMQASFFFLDIGGDHHASLAGLYVWLTVALLYGREALSPLEPSRVS